MRIRKLLRRALSGPQNFSFRDMITLVEAFGFRLDRVNGSHHIFSHAKLTELVNIQDAGGQAKPYQIRQFLKLVEQHDLALIDDEAEAAEEQ